MIAGVNTHKNTQNKKKIRAFVAFYCCLNIIVAVSFYYYHQLILFIVCCDYYNISYKFTPRYTTTTLNYMICDIENVFSLNWVNLAYKIQCFLKESHCHHNIFLCCSRSHFIFARLVVVIVCRVVIYTTRLQLTLIITKFI